MPNTAIVNPCYNRTELNQTRNVIIDNYKGLLIALVVIRHALQFSVSDEGGY